MLISFAVPCGNRLNDLKNTLPYLIAAANASPPVEISILDYASTDGLEEYMRDFISHAPLLPNTMMSFRRYSGRDHFHKTHAFNLAILVSRGEYFCLMPSDGIPEVGYIPAVRSLVADGCIWGHASDVCGIIFCQRKEFIEAGGYDERIEFYGGEDRELDARLTRRSAKFGLVPKGLVNVIYTPNEQKVKNYRLPLSKREMTKLTRAIVEENERNQLLVANPDGWGEWT